MIGALSGPQPLGHDDHDHGPVTTTTVAPTTTTRAADDGAHHHDGAPATTTTHERPTTTTTSSTTTTTTTPPTKGTSSSKTWGWVLLAVVIALAALLVGLLIARTRRQGREVNWDRSVGPAVTAAELARELMLSQTHNDDAEHRATVSGAGRRRRRRPRRAVPARPTRSTGADHALRDSLRGLAFAVEADHLMRSGGRDPDR